MIIMFVVILVILSLFAVKKYMDNSVVDKHGMIREDESNSVTVDLHTERKGVD